MVGILRKKDTIMEDYTIYPASYQLLDLLILEFCNIINETPISVIIKENRSEVKKDRILS